MTTNLAISLKQIRNFKVLIAEAVNANADEELIRAT